MNRTCVQCGSEKYYCKGLCKNCYNKQFVPSRWSEKSDFCLSCGSNEFPHVAHGLCRRCYATQETNILCACGCGLPVSQHGGKIKKYKQGHWIRMQGKDSEFQKTHSKKLSGANNPQYGKFGKDHPAYGHKTKPEVRELRRQAAIKRISVQKKAKTDIEIALSEILDELGIKHIPQYNFKNKFVVDEFLPEYNTIVEANGDYWHGNPSRFPNPNSLQKRNMRRDERRWNYIYACGFRVLFFWGNELLKNRVFCRRRLLEIKHSLVPLGDNSVK